VNSSYLTHPSDEDIECYVLGRATLAISACVEEHYIGCSLCVDRVDDLIRFIGYLRFAFSTNAVCLEPMPSRGMEVDHVNTHV
jgi:hypothetical protein